MSVIRTRPAVDGAFGRHEAHHTLTELTAADFRAATSQNPPDWAKGFTFRRVTAERARDWVDRGQHHETALYRGWDRHGRERILRASDGC
jgi:hypothetical protein